MKDHLGRNIKLVKENGFSKPFFLGPHGEGIIYKDKKLEYIIVANERRYWRGKYTQNRNFNKDVNLENISLIILKPDCLQRKLGEKCNEIFIEYGYCLVFENTFTFTKGILKEIYPQFMSDSMFKSMKEYLVSKECIFRIYFGTNPTKSPIEVRNVIRNIFLDKDRKNKFINVIHTSMDYEEAVQQTLALIKLKKLKKILANIPCS